MRTAARNKGRILVVDDNPINLKLAAELLEFEGYEVRRAANAGEAMKALAEGLPDLVLMDLQMPGVDGLTLTRRLKSEEASRRIPIVAMTAFAMKGDELKAREAGCDAYITKPIDTRKLGEQVSEVLRKIQNI